MRKSFFGLILLIALVSQACGAPNPSTPENTATSESAASVPATVTPTKVSTAVLSPTATSPVSTSTPPAGQEQPQELPPLSYEELLTAGVEAGLWTEGQGLVQLMKVLVGEVSAEEIPGISEVVLRSGTGISMLAAEYLDKPDSEPQYKADLERLLRILAPPQDVIDAISRPESSNGALLPSSKAQLVSFAQSAPAQQNNPECDALRSSGYLLDNEWPDTILCMYYKEADVAGIRLRVYYPAWLRHDEGLWPEWEPEMDIFLQSMVKAADTYLGFQVLQIPSFRLYLDWEGNVPEHRPYGISAMSDYDAYWGILLTDSAFDLSDSELSQFIAWEMFIGTATITFGANQYQWWLDASSAYFSNLVEPKGDLEWATLPHFDQRSTQDSIFQMGSENFVFFQFLGNVYGPEGVLDILAAITSGGDLKAFWNNPWSISSFFEKVKSGSPGDFNKFVVLYLSVGIPDMDTGAAFLSPFPARVTDRITIEQKDQYHLDTDLLVATRYFVDYQKEKRFLQAMLQDGSRVTSVEARLQQDISAWSAPPPEIRSSCQKDVRYLYVFTYHLVDEGQDVTRIIVDEAEQAVCDPCLLGTWQVDNPSFAVYMDSIFESQPEIAQIRQDWDFEISGQYYMQFDSHGKIFTQREDLAVGLADLQVAVQSAPDPDHPGPMPTISVPFLSDTTVLNSRGVGNYSADGELMKVTNFVDVPDKIEGFSHGVQVMQYTGAANLFTARGLGFIPSDQGLNWTEAESMSEAVEYRCGVDSLEITMPETGKDLFLWRVDKILPTPMPTPRN